MVDRTQEALATYKQMVAIRGRIEAGELAWSALGDYFTEDAVYIDSAWGRFAGQPAIKRFIEDSMVGLDDWRFPEEWTMADGDPVVSMWWNQLLRERIRAQPGHCGLGNDRPDRTPMWGQMPQWPLPCPP